MTVDVSKLREGDVVTLKAMIVANPSGVCRDLCAMPTGALNVINIKCLDIVSVETRPLKVGDLVTRREGGRVWTIRAIDAGAALLAAGRDLDAEYLANLNEAFL